MAVERFVVVVGVDFSDPGDRALDMALEIAAAREGGEVHVLHVQPERLWHDTHVRRDEASADTALREIEERAKSRMEAMRQRLGRLQRVVAHFRYGSPAERIMQLAGDLDADLVVVGSNGQRGFGLFLGSVAEQVARLSRCPVWIVRPKTHAVRASSSIAPPPVELQGAPAETADRPHYTYATNGICAARATLYDAAHAT